MLIAWIYNSNITLCENYYSRHIFNFHNLRHDYIDYKLLNNKGCFNIEQIKLISIILYALFTHNHTK